MKNTIKLDHENRRIVMDKTFAKLSADVRNEEYDILQRVRRDYPTYEVANRKIKKNPSKQSYKGLTYENMRIYVKDHSGAVSFEYKCLEEMIRASERNDMHYATIKQWFLDTYEEVKKNGFNYGIYIPEEVIQVAS